MIHAGFGGCLEFINAGLPTLTFPHFGDQGIVAQTMIDAGVSIGIIPSKDASSESDEKARQFKS